MTLIILTGLVVAVVAFYLSVIFIWAERERRRIRRSRELVRRVHWYTHPPITDGYREMWRRAHDGPSA